MKSITVAAYAKVNLYLRVLGTRPDGYHTLLTLFERVHLADALHVEQVPGEGIQFRCDHPQVPDDSTNLVVRAAHAYREETGWRAGLRFFLEKRIPVAAGLGGGSSDAAATLSALSAIGLPLNRQRMIALAKGLGADVPFFLAQTPWALGRGRGDEIEPVPLDRRLWHLLVTPEVAIPTAQVYRAFDALENPGQSLTAPGPDVTLLVHALRDQEAAVVSGHLFNALEPTVEALYPIVRTVKSALQALGTVGTPCLSGSGSTVFALADSEETARRAAGELARRQPGWRVWVVATQA